MGWFKNYLAFSVNNNRNQYAKVAGYEAASCCFIKVENPQYYIVVYGGCS